MIMGKKLGLVHWLLLMQLQYHCLYGAAASVQEKAETAIPITTMSPPAEGNTTFLGGTTWCVALSGVPQADLQNALDWACGLGMADCKPIQEGGACFDPDTLVSHASYAFNNYYQQNGNSEIACNFGGTAALTKADPSYGKCVYSAPGLASPAPPRPEHDPSLFGIKMAGILLMLLL
ncbi:glucan endo-1,3-beta-glucosidase-like [Syzygium oleosum]|uniref:glucan endo-1,3-beta-glucosidase-like n=1 Tax=Syzygium oleosum TaxID=219896 RepID=UPI0024BB5AFC|nr:glucan endo-1,3-beta-glucosidase-like [Syzygium oleosum]